MLGHSHGTQEAKPVRNQSAHVAHGVSSLRVFLWTLVMVPFASGGVCKMGRYFVDSIHLVGCCFHASSVGMFRVV